MIRYVLPQAPRLGLGAFMPGLTLNGVSPGAGLTRVYGFPGTVAVPVDHDQHLSQNGWDPKTQPSNVAPDAITPTLYVPGTRAMGPWSARGAAHTQAPGMGGNPLPVPAVALGVVPIPAFRPAKIGGRAVIGQPRVQPVWPSVNSGVP